MKAYGKTIVVTGAGNGIGREVTLLLLRKGARVAAVDLKADYLLETAALAGHHQNRLSTHVVDITDRDAVLALPEAVLKVHGSVDGVINVAGIIQNFTRISDMDFDAIERVFDVNFWGTMNMTKVFLPHLLGRFEAHIVNVSSMGGFLAVPGQTAYGASKAAVKLFSEGLHSELLDTSVHVTLVIPGAIATNIKANSGLAPDHNNRNQLTTPAAAAHIIVDSMEHDRKSVTIGSDAKMMDILCRFMPGVAARMINTQMRSHLTTA